MSSRRLLIFASATLLVAATAAAQQARDAIERFGANARQTREIYDTLDTIGANIDRLADQNNVQHATLRAIAELLGAENTTLTTQELVPLIAKRAGEAAAAQSTMARLALQLRFYFDMSPSGGGLMGASPT